MHLQRRPTAGFHHSIEGYFASVRGAFPDDLDVRVRVSRFASTGVWRRVYDIVAARCRRADIFHVTGDVHFLTFLLPRARTVLTVLDCGLGRAGGLTGAIYRALWLRLAVARAGEVVAISDATAAELSELARIPRARVHVIPVSVDDRYVPVPPEEDRGRPVILAVGSTPNKNVERIASALTGLDTELHIVGRLSDTLVAHLQSTGVRYRNDVGLNTAAMRRAYAECDVVAFASTYEGFGMPIVEANAVGRPVVTSSRAPMQWVAGDAAVLVDPEDAEAIRAAVTRILEDDSLRGDLVARGYRNRERFRPARVAAMYAELYREMGTRAGVRRKRR